MINLSRTDPTLYALLRSQINYERHALKMTASENFVSSAVLEATGSILTNKYAEGYPDARYYEGNDVVDMVENLARERLKTLFGAEHANVQPYSGSPANAAAYRATIQAGDKVMGLPVSAGGHLTHGWGVNFSGIDYARIPYDVAPQTGRVDYDRMRDIALRERPKLIWIGGTAYPRLWDYEAAEQIAREVDAYLVADVAHVSGLILAGVHPNPTARADIVTGTSHKTLRGPRGGFILCRREDRYQEKYHGQTKRNLATRVDRAVFPTLQGGPHINTVAALAVALKEAASAEFHRYGHRVVENARRLAEVLLQRGYSLVSGGTDNHMLILDLQAKPYSGREAAGALAKGGIIANFNMVPGDSRPPTVTSGVRLGTAALTTQGMDAPEMKMIGGFIDEILSNIGNDTITGKVRAEVTDLTTRYPPPGY